MGLTSDTGETVKDRKMTFGGYVVNNDVLIIRVLESLPSDPFRIRGQQF